MCATARCAGFGAGRKLKQNKPAMAGQVRIVEIESNVLDSQFLDRREVRDVPRHERAFRNRGNEKSTMFTLPKFHDVSDCIFTREVLDNDIRIERIHWYEVYGR